MIGMALLLLLGLLVALSVTMRWRGCYPSLPPVFDPGAEIRAAAMLRSVLSEEERSQLERFGFLEVHSPSVSNRVYRVPARPGHVNVYEADRLTLEVCVQPVGQLPADDVVLMHKLMIEGNEEGYLRQARVHWSRATG